MGIKTRISLLFASIIVVIIAIMGSILYAEVKINQALLAGRSVYAIVTQTSQLKRLATEISNGGISRLQGQWARKTAALRHAVGSHRGDEVIMEEMHSEMIQLDAVFSSLTAGFDDRGQARKIVDGDQGYLFRINHLSMLLHSISTLADSIAAQSHERIQRVQQIRDRVILGGLGIWAGFIFIWGIALWTGIMSPLRRLMDSIDLISRGDLGHRVKVR
ncbi:MAG: hypothetical protein MI799_23895, partial [Desulfobacterales bacterium]|nr:hypothetical protein [Desulfobacterales bacterium]